LVQHSEPGLPLIRPVGLESGLWPSRPAEPWSRVPTRAWIFATDIAVFANVSSASLGRRTFGLPCQGTSSLSSLWRIVPSLFSLTKISTLLFSDFWRLVTADSINSRWFSLTGIEVHLAHFVLRSRSKLSFELVISESRWSGHYSSRPSMHFYRLDLAL